MGGIPFANRNNRIDPYFLTAARAFPGKILFLTSTTPFLDLFFLVSTGHSKCAIENSNLGNINMAKKKKNQELDAMNETGRRKKPSTVNKERRKPHRRRQIDPTTCEREYSDPEIEFMQALDEYKRASGRMFPTCSEILEVITKLGYRRIADREEIYNPNADSGNSQEEFESVDEADFESIS